MNVYGFKRMARHIDEIFLNSWIDRRRHIEWPTMSPDLTSLYYVMWSYWKNDVYKTKPENIDELKKESDTVRIFKIKSTITGFVLIL